MSARTAEVARIKSPIKKELKHLGGKSQQDFPELLNNIVERLLNEEYKLIHVSKSYRKKDTIRSDNFWKKEEKIGNIKIVWICRLTVVFNSGFKFEFDFDYWFEFSKMIQNLRGDLYQREFPLTNRKYAENFADNEADRILERVEKRLKHEMRKITSGWGKHGIPNDVTEKNSTAICHRRKLNISSISQMGELRRNLIDLREEPIELVGDNYERIEMSGRQKLEELFPFEIEADSIEGYLAFFLWFRNPGGGFEFQLYRFIHENFTNSVSKEEIRDALLRLEVHGYTNVRESPKKIANKLKKRGIKRVNRFYETGESKIPEQILNRRLGRKVQIGAYLAPLPKKRLIRHLNAPDYKVNNKIEKLVRKNFLKKTKVKDSLGRTVQKLKTKRSFKNKRGLERKIMEKVKEFYDIQKDSLDNLQDARPDY